MKCKLTGYDWFSKMVLMNLVGLIWTVFPVLATWGSSEGPGVLHFRSAIEYRLELAGFGNEVGLDLALLHCLIV